MILLAAAAVLGASLGLWLRRLVLAVIIALATAGALQLAAMGLARALIGRAQSLQFALALQDLVGLRPSALLPTLAAAGCGAAFAAGLLAMAKGRGASVILTGDTPGAGGRRGWRPKFAKSFTERPAPSEAQSRFQQILKR
jgi:hypothetical protein